MTSRFPLLLSVCVANFFTSFLGSCLNVALPQMSLDFAVTPEVMTLAVTTLAISATVFLLPASALANRFGLRRCYTASLCAASLAAALITFLPNFPSLLGGRVIQGMFNAMIFCTSMSVLTLHVSGPARGFAIGLSTASVYAGLTFSPAMGGILVDALGWKSLFWFASAGYLLAAIPSHWIASDRPTTKAVPTCSMVLSVLVLSSILIALAMMGSQPWWPAPMVLGLALLWLFLRIQNRSNAPLLPVGQLKGNPTVTWELAATVMNFVATFVIALLLAMHYQLVLGMSASKAGMLLMVTPLAQCAATVFSGRLTVRFDCQLLAAAGMLVMSVGTALLALVTKETPVATLVMIQIVAGAGFGFFSTPNTTAVMNAVNRAQYALASSLIALARNFGMAVGMSTLTVILATQVQATVGTLAYIDQLQGAIRAAFTISTVTGLLGLAMCLRGWCVRRRN